MVRFITIFAFIFIALPGFALAQQVGNSDFYGSVTGLNRIKPLQNPEYQSSDKIVGRKILDNKNKVLGTVKDIVLTTNGSVSALYVDFDRLRLGSEVYLNYRTLNVEPIDNGYKLAYRDSQIEEMYPQFLADIESAAGEEDDTLSLNAVVGSPVRNAEGTRIGEVESVLFGSEGSWAEALYITMTSGTLRGQSVAVPFGLVEFKRAGKNMEVSLNKAQSDAIVDYLRDR